MRSQILKKDFDGGFVQKEEASTLQIEGDSSFRRHAARKEKRGTQLGEDAEEREEDLQTSSQILEEVARMTKFSGEQEGVVNALSVAEWKPRARSHRTLRVLGGEFKEKTIFLFRLSSSVRGSLSRCCLHCPSFLFSVWIVSPGPNLLFTRPRRKISTQTQRPSNLQAERRERQFRRKRKLSLQTHGQSQDAAENPSLRSPSPRHVYVYRLHASTSYMTPSPQNPKL